VPEINIFDQFSQKISPLICESEREFPLNPADVTGIELLSRGAILSLNLPGYFEQYRYCNPGVSATHFDKLSASLNNRVAHFKILALRKTNDLIILIAQRGILYMDPGETCE